MTVEATAVQRLRERIADGKVIVVVGAGVSIGATVRADGTPHPCASWAGLVRAGVEEMRRSGAPPEVVDYAEYLLRGQNFEQVADLIIEKLGNFYADWLERSFNSRTFIITNPQVPKALHALGCPILTTNYDHVLELTSGRGTLEWRNAEAWPQAQRDRTGYVLHIHGTFTNSKSVVFSRKNYEDLVNDVTSQSLWRSIATQYSLLFVGVGKSFDDRNFTRLGGYLSDVLGQAGQEHFRLVHAGQDDGVDRDGLFKQKIRHIEYGASPDDLAEFLTGLAPAAPEHAAASRLPPPAVLTIDVDDETVRATLRSDTASPRSVSERCGLTQTVLETLSLFDEWIRSDTLGGPVTDDRELKTRVIQQMGRILYEAVFPGAVQDLFRDGLRYQAQLRGEMKSAGQPDAVAPLEITLRIEKRIIPLFRSMNQIDLYDLPWELLWERGIGHLAASNKVILVRGTEDQSNRLEGWQPSDRLNVLVALAQPEELVSQIRASWPGGKGYDSVIADIRSAIGVLEFAEDGADRGPDPGQGVPGDRICVFELDDAGDETGNGREPRRCRVTWERFQAALENRAQLGTGSPSHIDVVHFIGHVGVNGLNRFVAFEPAEPVPGRPAADGTAAGGDDTDWVPFEKIGEFIRGLDERDRPTLVVLHLCQGPAEVVSSQIGRLDLTRASFGQLGYLLMQAQIPLVVAMQYPMWPDAGALFTRKFYGMVPVVPVPQAVQAARTAVSRAVTGASGPVGPVFFMGGDVRQILTPRPVARRDEAAAFRVIGRTSPSGLGVSPGSPLPGPAPGRTRATVNSGRGPAEPSPEGGSDGI